MVFCNADFEVSKTPAAPLATGLMAKKVCCTRARSNDTPQDAPEAAKRSTNRLTRTLLCLQAVNGAAHKSKNIRELAKHTRDLLEAASGIGWHVAVGTDFAVDLRYVRDSAFAQLACSCVYVEHLLTCGCAYIV